MVEDERDELGTNVDGTNGFEYNMNKYEERIEWFNEENDILRIDKLKLPSDDMPPESFKKVFHVLMTDFGLSGIDYAQNILAEYDMLIMRFTSPEEIYNDFREYKEEGGIRRRERHELLRLYESHKAKYDEDEKHI